MEDIKNTKILFFDLIDTEKNEEKIKLRAKVMEILKNSTPSEYIKQHDIHLPADEIKRLTKHLNKMIDEFERRPEEYKEEIERNQNEHNATLNVIDIIADLGVAVVEGARKLLKTPVGEVLTGTFIPPTPTVSTGTTSSRTLSGGNCLPTGQFNPSRF